MGCDLAWMIGRSFVEVSPLEGPSWGFRFGDGTEVRADSPWRLVSGGGIVLSSEDHGHWYGRSKPIDAGAECRGRLVGSVILSAEVRDETRAEGDILIPPGNPGNLGGG